MDEMWTVTPTLGDFLTIFGNVEPYLPANTSQLLNAYINMTQVSTEYVLYCMLVFHDSCVI